MTAKPWMPLYVADYLQDTAHLSAAEHGAYLLLIMYYWANGSLPDEDKRLARIARMTEAEWQEAKPVVAEFFSDGWKHGRIEFEMTEAARISAAGKAGGRASAEARQRSRNDQPTIDERSANDLATIGQALQSQSHSKKEDMGATRPPADEKFEEFKKAYPRRRGANPWKPARAQWDAALRAGASSEQIIAAVKAGVGYDTSKIDTEYIPQAVKWLRDRRFEDYALPNNVVLIGFYAAAESGELAAWDAHKRAEAGTNMPRDKNGGWYVPTRWPPGYEAQTATG